MPNTSAGVSYGNKKTDGGRQTTATPSGATADVTITIASPPTMSLGEFLAACREAASQLGIK